MSGKPARQEKLFTIEEANATLPLVGAIVTDLVRTSREVIERQHSVAQLTAGRDLETGDPYAEELVQVQEQMQLDIKRVQEYLEELTALGVQPKSATEGLVDFPSRMDSRIVYLCWKLGEPEVAHWHELDAGFSGRHPLATELVGSQEPDEDASTFLS